MIASSGALYFWAHRKRLQYEREEALEKLRREYWHRDWGRVIIIGTHPYDGATLVVMRQSTTDLNDDDHSCDICERSDLRLLSNTTWPYLGHTNRERSDRASQAWASHHGFAQVPAGSGWWYYSGTKTRVPADVWRAAWNENYLKIESETK